MTRSMLRSSRKARKLARVMEIARLEISTQNHLDRMQETAKLSYVQYGKSTKNKKSKKFQQSGPSTGLST